MTITPFFETLSNSVEPIVSICGRGPQPLCKGQPFVLCIAQHRKNKNILLGLKVFERALHDGALAPDTQFVVIGVPGPETQPIHRQIRAAGLERQVIVLSGITDTELQWCYRNCELLLAPSIVEGFGLPVVEALLAGCRVACSDIPAFREVGGDGCSYVPLGHGEIEGFVNAIRTVRAAPRILPVSMPWLSASRIAEKYITLYRHLQIRPVNEEYGTLRISHIGSRDGM